MAGALDDLYGPFALALKRLLQLGAAVATVGEDVMQERIETVDRLQDGHGSVAVLNGGAVHHEADHEAVGVGHDVSLAAL